MPKEVAERLTELRRRKHELLPSESQELGVLLGWEDLLIKKRNRIEDRRLDREQREELDK